MQLQLSDGTTTLTLSGSGDYHGVTYYPASVSLREALEPDTTVTEEVTVVIRASTAANAQTARQAIESLLYAAIQRQKMGTGPRVYAQYTAYTGDDTYRSEILDGDVSDSSNWALRNYASGNVVITVTWERRPYWEGQEATLFSSQSLTNGSGHDYYSTTTVNGVLPTPALVQLYNDSGGAQTITDVYYAINALHGPNGAYANINTTSKSLSDTAPYTFSDTQASWAFGSDQAFMRGDYFRFVAAVSVGDWSGKYWRLQIKNSTTALATGDPIYPASAIGLYDFGTLPMPPGGYLDDYDQSVTLYLQAQSDTVNIVSTLPYLYYFPAHNFRKLQPIVDLPSTYYLVDDGIEGRCFMSSDGSGQGFFVGSEGNVPHLYPGNNHRFLWAIATGSTFDASETAEATVKYRPRRITV